MENRNLRKVLASKRKVVVKIPYDSGFATVFRNFYSVDKKDSQRVFRKRWPFNSQSEKWIDDNGYGKIVTGHLDRVELGPNDALIYRMKSYDCLVLNFSGKAHRIIYGNRPLVSHIMSKPTVFREIDSIKDPFTRNFFIISHLIQFATDFCLVKRDMKKQILSVFSDEELEKIPDSYAFFIEKLKTIPISLSDDEIDDILETWKTALPASSEPRIFALQLNKSSLSTIGDFIEAANFITDP